MFLDLRSPAKPESISPRAIEIVLYNLEPHLAFAITVLEQLQPGCVIFFSLVASRKKPKQ
jgi:hypothetical protein